MDSYGASALLLFTRLEGCVVAGGRLGCALLVGLIALSSACGEADPRQAEYEAAMEQLMSQIREERITEGAFGMLVVGASKDEVLKALGAMGATSVYPDLKVRIRVTRPADLDRLRSVGGVIIGAGSVVVKFDGDDVVRILVARIYPRWGELLEGAQTRDQVFSALRTILEEDGDVVVRSMAHDSRYVLVDAPGTDGRALLDRYDLWRVVYEDGEGHWSLKLEFNGGYLTEIFYWYSPVEVP